MFRELRRKKQELPRETCVEILKKEPRGVLSVLGDDGYPYGVPMDHWYCEEDGGIYFHSGKAGHKIDAIRRCEKASFCVTDSGFRREGEWALNISSVIVFGRIEFVSDRGKTMEICRSLSYKYTSDEAYISGEIERFADAVVCFALVPEHMTGKIVNES